MLSYMSAGVEIYVPDDLVWAAVRAAGERGLDVADVPLTAVAAVAGISRSTLLRRIGGSRAALDDAVRTAGVDPGGRPPVRQRAVIAAARLISEQGLAAVTLEAVAAAAECSVHSLYAAFGGRDALLTAVFEAYTPIVDVERITAEPRAGRAGLAETTREVYRAFVAAMTREPRVMPALLGEVFSRPDGPAGEFFERHQPRMLGSVGAWLAAEVHKGRVRPLPTIVLVQQLIGPLALGLLFRPVLARLPGVELPTVDETSALLADNFLRAVGKD